MADFDVRQIEFELTAVSNFFSHRIEDIEKRIYPEGLNASYGYIVSYLCLHENDNIFQRDIERAFDLNRSTVSTILKELEAEGLIERKPVVTDARLKKVVPTQAAKMINSACNNEVEHFFYDLASDVTEKEMLAFEKVLKILNKNSGRLRK